MEATFIAENVILKNYKDTLSMKKHQLSAE